jgi:hypothetical protein
MQVNQTCTRRGSGYVIRECEAPGSDLWIEATDRQEGEPNGYHHASANKSESAFVETVRGLIESYGAGVSVERRSLRSVERQRERRVEDESRGAAFSAACWPHAPPGFFERR